MSFVATGLLAAGVLAASVPILIHLLLRRRTRPLEWAAMSILIEAARRHRSRSRIERILLLVIRTLMIVLLAASGSAYARPFRDPQMDILDFSNICITSLLLLAGRPEDAARAVLCSCKLHESYGLAVPDCFMQ